MQSKLHQLQLLLMLSIQLFWNSSISVDIPAQRCVPSTRLRGNTANYSTNATGRGSNSRTQMMTRLRSNSSQVPFTSAGGSTSFAAYSIMPYSRPIYLLPAHQSLADALPARALPQTGATRGRSSTARGSRANRNNVILPPSS